MKGVYRNVHINRDSYLSQRSEPEQSGDLNDEETLPVLQVKLDLTKAHKPAHRAVIGLGDLFKRSSRRLVIAGGKLRTLNVKVQGMNSPQYRQTIQQNTLSYA